MNIQLFQKNMRLAQQALDHVKHICFFGSASDRYQNEKKRRMKIQVVTDYRSKAISDAHKHYLPSFGISLQHYFMFLTAQYAKQAGIGNCMEQSYLAYEFLAKKTKPVDVYKIKSLRKTASKLPDGDHMFAVIGLSTRRDSSLLPIHEMNIWNREAVICDPWSQNAYPAYMYTVKAISGGGWHLIQHVCDNH